MRFAVLVSGGGTNLQSLLDHQSRGELAPAEVALVVSNRPGVKALERAETAGVASVVIDHTSYETRASFEDALLETLRAQSIDAVVLAGFMRVLTERFVSSFPNRILNTHPALCPAFPGIHAPQQALDHGVKITGCTVHFVDSGVDTGPIIFQRAVEVLPDDDAASLHERIRRIEHELLPRATKLLAAGQLSARERHVELTAEYDAD
jgi:formyltetrahydrofolate-dependent phosphoribosylglycinamide formyltransferase